jgi:hypothetical protein
MMGTLKKSRMHRTFVNSLFSSPSPHPTSEGRNSLGKLNTHKQCVQSTLEMSTRDTTCTCLNEQSRHVTRPTRPMQLPGSRCPNLLPPIQLASVARRFEHANVNVHAKRPRKRLERIGQAYCRLERRSSAYSHTQSHTTVSESAACGVRLVHRAPPHESWQVAVAGSWNVSVLHEGLIEKVSPRQKPRRSRLRPSPRLPRGGVGC